MKTAIFPFRQPKKEPNILFFHEDLALMPASGIPEELRKLSRFLPVIQENGLGHLLMNEILATAHHEGIAELFLRVQKANQSAVDFYSRSGFRMVAEESFRVGARDHAALVMRLALATPAEHRS